MPRGSGVMGEWRDGIVWCICAICKRRRREENEMPNPDEQILFSVRNELDEAKKKLFDAMLALQTLHTMKDFLQAQNIVLANTREQLAKTKEELATMKSLYEEQVSVANGMRKTLENIASYTEKLKKG